jgi:4-coumarate--CoA ligase
MCFHRKMLIQASRTPANPAYTAAELAFQLKDSGAKALVTQASCLKLALEATEIANIPKTRILLIGEEKSNQVQHFTDFIASAKNKPALDRASSSHTDLAYIVYSSGTTGYVLQLVSLCRLIVRVMDNIIPLV